MSSGARPTRFARVVGWLRSGQPKGLVQRDYIALFGVLHRDLTPAEVDEIARSLLVSRGEGGPTHTRDQIQAAISAQIHERALDRDIRAVAARLAGLVPPHPADDHRQGDHTRAEVAPPEEPASPTTVAGGADGRRHL
ncbi:MAG TPA: DUF3349 domain-containing protein [Dermatophilaceae bacterium]|nr:DUF3349 domain-containing protein [Dermatophilaceae bacterium]